MNDYFRDNIECGQACKQWFIDYAFLIPGGSKFEVATTGMTAKADHLESLAGEQETAKSEGFSATDVKASERGDLIAAMSPVRDAARAAEFDVPGTRDRYRYNEAMSDQQLLAAGRSFAAGAVDDDALLESYGAPHHWGTAVTAACDAFEASFGPQDSAKGESVAKNAEMKQTIKEMNAFKSQIRHFVKIYCANNPGARAAWDSAAHVKKSSPPDPTTP